MQENSKDTIHPVRMIASSEHTERGIDVSSYQGHINFKKVKEDGLSIVYLRTSIGKQHIDPSFHQNYYDAKSAELKIGFLHFLTASTIQEAIHEAIFFVSCIGNFQPDVALAVDFGSAFQLKRALYNNILYTFINEVKKLSNKPIIIYSNTTLAKQLLHNKLKEVPLWIADYTLSAPEVTPLWNTWDGWQYTDIAKVNGIKTYTNKNYFSDHIFLKDSSVITPIASPYLDKEKYCLHYYRIKHGDTISSISKFHKIESNLILELNHLSPLTPLTVGSILLLPRKKFFHTYYKVKEGDMLETIASTYHTKVSLLVGLNREKLKKGNLIYPEEKLLLPWVTYL